MVSLMGAIVHHLSMDRGVNDVEMDRTLSYYRNALMAALKFHTHTVSHNVCIW